MEVEVKKQPYQQAIEKFKENLANLNRHAGFMQSEFQQLSIVQRLIFFMTTYALFPIMVLFNDEPLVSVDGIGALPEDLSDMVETKADVKANIKRYMQAASKLPRFYVLPSLPLIAFFSIQHLIVHACLQSTLSLRVWNFYYQRFSNSLADPRFLRDVALYLRPFLTWFLMVPPVVIVMLIYRSVSTIKEAISPDLNSTKIKGLNCFRMRQQVDKKPSAKEKEFFYSPWFTPVALSPFLLGLPAMFSYYLYWHNGLDRVFGYPSQEKLFVFVIPFICLYLTSLGWALSTLFFRSYFTIGLSYTSTEYDIEVYHDVIKMLPIKGWFADFITYRGMHSPTQIMWKDVTSIKVSGSAEPVQLHSQSSNKILSFFLKLGESYELAARKMDIYTNYLTIASDSRTIDIRLWELSAKEKVELFKSIREFAPSIYLDATVQKALIGSSIMREPKYTEIWFSVLQNHALTCEAGDLAPQTILKNGAYRVDHKLAAGGQGVIYRAFDSAEKPVVLKEFILIADESLEVMIESAKEFENETKILHSLDHPNVVRLLDMFHENGRVYIALEYVEGQSLRELVRENGPLPIAQVLDVGIQMCEILEYLHSLSPGIIHRDFTPENLILQPDGKLKLIDFSVAQEKTKDRSSECAGKHSYTPPEQFRGEALPLSDVYACGATMYFLATGTDPEPITTSKLTQPDEPLQKELSEIIASATALDVTNRCPSAQWLRATLVAANEEQRGSASPLPLF